MNGKVNRAQQTDLNEFWALVDFSSDHLSDQLSEYQHYYNCDRIHGSLGKTPLDREVELSQQAPFWDEVEGKYNLAKEHIRLQDYAKHVRLFKLNRSL